MVDKLLMAARKAAAGYRIHRKPTAGEAAPDCILESERELFEQMNDELAADDRLPDELIECDAEAFAELAGAVGDYFAVGRSPSTCKWCQAPLVWVVTAANKKRMPLDACPIEGLDADGVHHRIHLAHHATCPAIAKRRAAKKAAANNGSEDGKSKAAN